MIEFAYSLISVGFRAILMQYLSFLSQKTYPGEFLKPEIILSRNYLRKCSIWPTPLSSSICQNPINSEPLEANIFRIFMSLWYLPVVKTSIKTMRLGWHAPRWFHMELPNEASFPLSNGCYDHCKNVFYRIS